MKRLLQVGFDTLLLSVLPILMWILLGFIIDKDISNVFTLTYPLQFLFALFENVFGRGANIVAEKEKDKNVVDANIIVGCLIIGLISLTLAFNVDRYIEFFNMDVGIYHDFCLYSMISIYFTFVIQIVLQKIYFDGKNTTANKVSCLFNLANFFSIVGLSSAIRPRIAITITLMIDAIIVLSVLIKNVRWPKFELKLSKTIKYSSFSIIRNISMFLTYIIGFNRSFSLGAIYIATINFESMMTDTQWDILYSVDTVSKIDISEGKFDYRKSLKNAYKLIFLLIVSSVVMTSIMYWYYKPNIKVLGILLGIQYADMLLTPIRILRLNYIQIQNPSVKNDIYYAAIRVVRIACAFIPSVFCTCIGQIVSGMCLLGYALYECRESNVFRLRSEEKCTN